MYYKRRKNNISLRNIVNTMYGQNKTEKLQLRLTPDFKEHIKQGAKNNKLSVTNFILACVIKQIGNPKSKIHTYLTDEDLEL